MHPRQGGYDKILREGRKVLSNILDIESPMIAALNGPVLLHSEYALLTDIILATPETVFQDKPHFDLRIVPATASTCSGRKSSARFGAATSS